MSNRITIRTRRDSLASHILPVSGTMIGVCATLIGLAKLAAARHGASHVDEYAAIVAVTFLASALASYLSIRWSDRLRLSVRIEGIADTIFLCGLVGITLVATLFAYEVI
jgi:MFS family permease